MKFEIYFENFAFNPYQVLKIKTLLKMFDIHGPLLLFPKNTANTFQIKNGTSLTIIHLVRTQNCPKT